MVNKVIKELLTLVYKSDLSKVDKKKYSKVIMLAFRRFQMETGVSLEDDPELMKKMLASYEKKKEIMKSRDKAAWKKLLQEEEGELETMIIGDLKEEENAQLEEIRAKIVKGV
ncbi:hypothetical protein HOB10_05635 [Candidatus Parcubacteria bacterium]|jgi:hypothetical protein|nr:hypothetical protein [Candidatus Parcubacteria bacterium]